MTPPQVFVFGLGYTGLAFARAMHDAGATVGGTVRSAGKAEALRAEGIAAVVFDGTNRSTEAATALGEATHVLVTISQGAGGDPVLAAHGSDLAAAPHLAWAGYLSTVGVYGDHGGAWIDEETPPDPRIARAAARIAAEDAWQRFGTDRGVPVGVFRLAGIYGPGRNPFVKLAEGSAHRIVKPGQVFNRIHVADIAATLRAAMERPAARTYNVADDEPAPPQDVVTYAAGLMGAAPPPEVAFAEADLSPMARSFYEGNRRISNRRIRDELGVVLAYPTYRAGLSALWQDGNWRA
jgi:nucleoside-diphosphate-sugar epimerase